MEISEVYQNLSRNVRYLRRVHNLSQKSLASLLGIGVGSLRGIEKGISMPRINCVILCRMADVFGVSADALLYEDIEQSQVES